MKHIQRITQTSSGSGEPFLVKFRFGRTHFRRTGSLFPVSGFSASCWTHTAHSFSSLHYMVYTVAVARLAVDLAA